MVEESTNANECGNVRKKTSVLNAMHNKHAPAIFVIGQRLLLKLIKVFYRIRF